MIVDDGSTDDTGTRVAEWQSRHGDVMLVRQENAGKGAAIRAAIPYIDGDIAVIQDADMEYDPADVPALIEPIVRGVADVVYGSRLSGGRPQRAYLFWHLVGNGFSRVTGILYNTTLADMETGYKAFRSDVLRSLDLRQNDFSIEPEITAKVCKRKLRVYQLPIAYYGRTPRARRSPGGTASRRSGCSPACAFAVELQIPDVDCNCGRRAPCARADPCEWRPGGTACPRVRAERFEGLSAAERERASGRPSPPGWTCSTTTGH